MPLLKHLLRRFIPRNLLLIQKLTILTGTVVVLFMTIFAWIHINSLQHLLVKNETRDLDNLADSIIRVTRHQMMLDDRVLVYQIIDEMAKRPGIVRIRLANHEGVIVHSTHVDEVGKRIDQQAFKCVECHHDGSIPELKRLEERSRFYNMPNGQQVMALARSICNSSGCSTSECHTGNSRNSVLGVVDIAVSMDTLKSDLASYRNRIVFSTVLLILFLGASLTFFTLYLVNRPVTELLYLTNKVAEGDLNCKIVPTSNDELGQLMLAFQAMTNKLRQAREDLEAWGHTLEEKVEERSEQLQRMQMQLVHTEKLASLGELVAGIAHEINNPLSGILIFSDLLAKDKRLDPALSPDLETISSEAKRCAGIVKGLLEFARDYQPRTEPTDINQVLVDSLRLVEKQSTFQNVAIVRQLAPDLPHILADQNQLKQVFINILINAGQAMQDLKRGKLIINTEIAKTDGNETIRILISDSGAGIPEEQVNKLFDPFFTTKGTGGTGLGLAVSYGIIQSHGGNITVNSTVGVGTTFIISLPSE